MHANRADIGRPNVVGNAPPAGIVKTSSSSVHMWTGSEIEQGSKFCQLERTMIELALMIHRQLGSLARKVEDYEQLLEDLSLRAAPQDQDLIRTILDNVCLNSGSSLPHANNSLPGAIFR